MREPFLFHHALFYKLEFPSHRLYFGNTLPIPNHLSQKQPSLINSFTFLYVNNRILVWFVLSCFFFFLVQFFSSSLFLCYCSLSLSRTSLFCALLINFMPDWFLYLDSQSSPVLFKISRERGKNEFYCAIWILRLFVAFINGNLSYLISHVYSLQFDNIFYYSQKNITFVHNRKPFLLSGSC